MNRFQTAPNFDEVAGRAARPALKEAAAKIAERARQVAPIGTGHYMDSIRVEVDDRGVVIESTDVAGHIVESGSVNNPAYSPLRRAGADVAKRFDPS